MRGELLYSRWKVEDGDFQKGGNGVVFEVSDSQNQFSGKLALKQLLRTDRMARFQREIKVSAALNHPNLVHVLHHDCDASPPYIVMPWADHTLAEPMGLYRSPAEVARAPWFRSASGAAMRYTAVATNANHMAIK
jgi:serine/threonine protein kinase